MQKKPGNNRKIPKDLPAPPEREPYVAIGADLAIRDLSSKVRENKLWLAKNQSVIAAANERAERTDALLRKLRAENQGRNPNLDGIPPAFGS